MRAFTFLLLGLVVASGVQRPRPATATPDPSRGSPPLFSGENALRLVRKQCAFGPRNPLPTAGVPAGAGGHERCREFLAGELTRLAGSVRRQEFTWTLPKEMPMGGGSTARMTNIVASFAPELKERVLLCAHWDTRPWSDQDPDKSRRAEPILGANDGASGVAVLLELARLLKEQRPALGVDIALFDGEDLGTEAHPEGYFRGAGEYALRLGQDRPRYAILLDMVGDADLQFKREGYSLQMAPGTLEWLWAAGRTIAPDHFLDLPGYFILDDHIPLLKAGVPCVDLIDFDYPAWHTHADTPDRVSSTSLQIVGDVLVRLLYPDPAQ